MSTAQTIVNNALRLVNLNSNIQGVDPYHQQIGFQVLVDWLVTERGKRIYVTPQIPASISADLKEKPWAKKAIEYSLAYDLIAPLQIRNPPPTLMDVKKSAYRTLYINAKPSTTQQFPDTLPIGSGNRNYFRDTDWLFYNEYDETTYDHEDTVNKDEALTFYADFDADATMRSTSVSSVLWTQETGTVVISGQTLSSNLASALFTFPNEGTSKVKALATYANGEKKAFTFKIQAVSSV